MSKVTNCQKVVVGLSGGVDSSVSAFILKQMGYEVEGLFMKNWDMDDGTAHCTAMSDFEDALRVAQKLNIPCHTVSFSNEYWDQVFRYFLQEYKSGRTPNPDILCNKEIKFKAFLDHAKSLDADYIATGHYAQTMQIGNHTTLVKGSDPDKDQSYFLYAVSESALRHALFPVGGMRKSEVRCIARQQGLVTHDKKDSTGICFIGERKFKDFLKTFLPALPGHIVTDEGKVIGQHEGLMYHTIGQRQGLGIGGLKGYQEIPWYVVGKNLERNELIVAQGQENPLLYQPQLTANNLEWINPDNTCALFSHAETIRCRAKIRYRQADQPCTLTLLKDRARVTFDAPQRAVTPGQSVVFYNGLRCLGGGIIQANDSMHGQQRDQT